MVGWARPIACVRAWVQCAEQGHVGCCMKHATTWRRRQARGHAGVARVHVAREKTAWASEAGHAEKREGFCACEGEG